MIDGAFPTWTENIRLKMEVLTRLHIEEGLPGEDLATFLDRKRAEFDTLKDNDDIELADPDFDVPVVSQLCDQEVHDAVVIANVFRDLLEDCASYLEWLRAQEAGYCELDQFNDPTTGYLTLAEAEKAAQQ